MDFEAPLDAWYVWIGVAFVSIALLSLAVALPSEPPPDAEATASAIDRVAASEYGAATEHTHDGTDIRVGPEQIALRNDAGTDYAHVSYGQMVPVYAATTEANRTTLEDVLAGTKPLDETQEDTVRATATTHETGDWHSGDGDDWHPAEGDDWQSANGDDWYPADGTLRARALTIDDERYVLVSG